MWAGYAISKYVTKESQGMKETLLAHIYQGIIHNSEDTDSIMVSIDKWAAKESVLSVCTVIAKGEQWSGAGRMLNRCGNSQTGGLSSGVPGEWS